MHRPFPRTPIAIALALAAAGMSQVLAARPAHGHAPVPLAPRSDEYSYRDALGGLWNYQSCGVRGRAADYRALAAQLQAIEAMARAKGLGPTLDRVRAEYERILAVSTMVGCGGGPAGALAGARRAMAAFRAWVDAQP